MGAPLLQEDAGDRDLPCPVAPLQSSTAFLPAYLVYQHPYSCTNLVGHWSHALKTSGARCRRMNLNFFFLRHQLTMNDPEGEPDDGPEAIDDETVLTPHFDAQNVVDPKVSAGFSPTRGDANRPAIDLPPEFFPNHLPAGYQVDDFCIVAALGRGAFACVYLAQQLSMHRLVALKISIGLTSDAIDFGESQTLARLDHPGIVRVFDQRRLEGRDAHLLYMQYLPGGTLAGVVERVRMQCRSDAANDREVSSWSSDPESELTGRVLLDSVDENLLSASQQVPEHSEVRDWIATAPWPMVVAWIGVRLSRALHAAHGQGVFHRDVKPANVLLSAEGRPRLADFNVSFSQPASISPASASPSSASTDDSAVGSAGGSIGGSIAYMSPEHLRAVAMLSGGATRSSPEHEFAHEFAHDVAHDVDARADVYSTGVLLWELWQGERPYLDEPPPVCGADWFARQIELRGQSPRMLSRTSSAKDLPSGSERVLEQVLRQAVAPDPADRPQTAEELSARLRLALFPEAARLFDPSADSWAGRCSRLSPWLVATAFILLPNIAAGFFNFLYNDVEIIQRHPELRPRFLALANTVNWISFPLGGLLMIVIARPVAAAVAGARAGQPNDGVAITRTIELGLRAAWIGGLLWLAAAFVFPIVLVTGTPSLPPLGAVHFFGSLLICGGVAAVYPFFGLVVMATRIYYPCLVRKTMRDEEFDRHHDDVRRWCARFLLAAAGIPLLGLALLLSRETMARYVVASAVAATAIGLVAAFAAFQCVHQHWETMSEILSKRKQAVGSIRHERLD